MITVSSFLLHYPLYLRRQWWRKSKLEAYQDKRLRGLIRYANRHVPYYRKLFRDIGLDPGTFRGRSDMAKIPLLDKETVRTKTEEFVTENVHRFAPSWLKTSGSTGSPLAINFCKGVVASQLVQDTIDHCYLNIIPGSDFIEEYLQDVEKGLRNRLGHTMKIDFRIVSELERRPSGKTPFAISRIRD